MPISFVLDKAGFVFCSFSLALVSWAVLDTRRFLRRLSLGRKTTFTNSELMVLKVPGTIVIAGLLWLLLGTFLQHG